MNSIYRFLLKGSNWILAGLLFMLGFNVVSCGVEEEYGSPYAEFRVKGKVTDMNGTPIQGAGITLKSTDDNKKLYPLAGDYEMVMPPLTKEDGSYDITFQSFPEHSLRIIAEDIDGLENGSFKTDSIDVEVGDLKGGKSWYMGKALVNAPDIKLKEEKEE